jgi:hypothetical protein
VLERSQSCLGSFRAHLPRFLVVRVPPLTLPARSYPSGIAVIPQTGWIVVADMMNNRCVVLTIEGAVVSVFGREGSGPGEMVSAQCAWERCFGSLSRVVLLQRHPADVAIARNNIIVVSEWTGQRLQLFTLTGTALATIETNGNKECYGVCYDKRRDLILAVDRDIIGWSEYRLDGKVEARYSAAALGCPLCRPCGIGVNEIGEVLISDAERNCIHKFRKGTWCGMLLQGHTDNYEKETAIQGGAVVMRVPSSNYVPGSHESSSSRVRDVEAIAEAAFLMAGRMFAFPCLFDVADGNVFTACILSNSVEHIRDGDVTWARRRNLLEFYVCTRGRKKYERKGMDLPKAVNFDASKPREDVGPVPSPPWVKDIMVIESHPEQVAEAQGEAEHDEAAVVAAAAAEVSHASNAESSKVEVGERQYRKIPSGKSFLSDGGTSLGEDPPVTHPPSPSDGASSGRKVKPGLLTDQLLVKVDPAKRSSGLARKKSEPTLGATATTSTKPPPRDGERAPVSETGPSVLPPVSTPPALFSIHSLLLSIQKPDGSISVRDLERELSRVGVKFTQDAAASSTAQPVTFASPHWAAGMVPAGTQWPANIMYPPSQAVYALPPGVRVSGSIPISGGFVVQPPSSTAVPVTRPIAASYSAQPEGGGRPSLLSAASSAAAPSVGVSTSLAMGPDETSLPPVRQP